MKLAAILFISAILLLLLVPFSVERIATADLNRNGQESKVAKQYFAFYSDMVRVSTTQTTRTSNLGFAKQVILSAGFQLINDSSVGDQLILTGPPEALENVRISKSEGTLNLSFKQPITLNQPVKVMLDLAKHHVGELHLILNQQANKLPYQSLVTTTPITGKYVTIDGTTASDEAISFDVEKLNWNAKPQDSQTYKINLRGNAADFTTSLSTTVNLDLHEMNTKRLVLQSSIPQGQTLRIAGDEIQLHYLNEEETLNEELKNMIPDTLMVNSSAKVTSRITVNNEWISLDSLIHLVRE